MIYLVALPKARYNYESPATTGRPDPATVLPTPKFVLTFGGGGENGMKIKMKTKKIWYHKVSDIHDADSCVTQ